MASGASAARAKRHGRNTGVRRSDCQWSSQKRKLIEEAFGWAKTIGGLARMKLRGTRRMGFAFTLAMAAYNLIRLPKLIGTATA